MKILLTLALASAVGCNTLDLSTPLGVPASPTLSVTANTVDTLAFNLPYTSTNNAHQQLDVFRPHGVTGVIPAVVCIHGGYWRGGDKNLSPNDLCWRNLARGMAVVALNYRLSSDSVWPAQMHDIFTAIRCIRAKASLYGIDAARIGVLGTSAGAQLALMTGVTSDTSLLGLSLGCKGRRSDVKAVVSVSGPTDLIAMPSQLALDGCPANPKVTSSVMQLLGLTSLTTVQDSIKVASISPVNNIRRLIPIAMWHGDVDCVVAYQQMTNMSSAMALRGAVVTVNIAPGLGHGIKDPAIADAASSFMYTQLTH
ncbi:MAG: alpha/beta hydrolase [Gemmatimonadaceae bacterium]